MLKLLQTVSSSTGFRQLLDSLPTHRSAPDRGGQNQVVFPYVPDCAVGFLSSLVASEIAPRRLWIVCAHLREQELLASELPVWGISPTFLPENEDLPESGGVADPELVAERLLALSVIARGSPPSAPEHSVQAGPSASGVADSPDSPARRPHAIVLTQTALTQTVPPPDSLSGEFLNLSVGDAFDAEALSERLALAGFERVATVVSRGQWSLRGGICDIFGLQSTQPLRIEEFDGEIESLRWFDVDSQVSTGKTPSAELMLAVPEPDRPLHEWIPPGDLVLSTPASSWPGDIAVCRMAVDDWDEIRGGESALAQTRIHESPLGEFEAGDFVMEEARRKRVFSQLEDWRATGWTVAMWFASKGEKARFLEMCDPRLAGWMQTHDGELPRGFTIPAIRLAVLSSSEIFGRFQTASARRRANRQDKARQQRAQAELREFEEGDLVVHATAGIGRYLGIRKNDDAEEVLAIEYRNDSLLLVPLSHAHLVARYVGLGSRAPELNKLGDGRWLKTRKTAEAEITDYAAQLLHIQASRATSSGLAHAPDSRWMWEFENSFPYRETPDQLRAIQQAKADMESSRPMDRLICGDVGFGKTEVAIRAAFKAVTGGRQVALLVPTTVLAEQHWRNFRERMSGYPVRIDLLNRFRTQAETSATLAGVADGSVDIVIGTHRLVSKDVRFKNLGLAIIDEEQRFGVKHKEEFKGRFAGVDILTLSATPIPRTLYLALMGARDMSTIETPPPNRIPVQTFVAAYNEQLITRAIRRELQRGGQVYFLHNRVQTIDSLAARLLELVPEARIAVGHGQMPKSELEAVMRRFVSGKADILLATTIIESGIDIPNANTILIDRADRFGLADLYQLRGRVGRAGHQAWAYLLLPPSLLTTGDARRRLDAIKEYTALGSGFRVAMRDLEIRGAGNLLGTRQSGHIAAIGFDLYCQLLRQSIESLQGKKPVALADANLRIDFLILSEAKWMQFLGSFDNPERRDARVGPCFLPVEWMEDSGIRISAYKALAEAPDLQRINALESAWSDRFGQIPDAAALLLDYHRLRVAASRRKVSLVEIRQKRVMVTRNGELIRLPGGKFPELVAASPSAKLKEALALIQTLP